MERRSVQNRNPATKILIAVILLCVAGFAGYYFGVLKRIHLTAIEISHPLPIEFSKSRQLTAVGRYPDNRTEDVTGQINWQSSEPDVASVSNAKGTRGLVTGGSAGKATISATDPDTGIVGKTIVTVLEPHLASITLSPIEPSITLGEKQQIKATGLYADGKRKDISPSVVWSSSDISVAFLEDPIGSPGMVTSAAAGSTIITARDPETGITGTMNLTVSEAQLISFSLSPDDSTVPLGSTFSLSATGTFSDGTEREIAAQLLWASMNRDIADVNDTDPDKGSVYTKSIGSAVITATDPATGLSGSATVKVTQATILSLEIQPKNPSIPLGENQPFTAMCRFSDGSSHVLTNLLNWYSSDTSVAQFSGDGDKKGTAFSGNIGATKITAKDPQSGKAATTTLTVTAAKPVSLEITPAHISISLGTWKPLRATATLSDGSFTDMTATLTWMSSDPSVAMVETAKGRKGIVNAKASGVSVITATDPVTGIQATSDITVTGTELTSIQIEPDIQTVPLGFNAKLIARGNFSDNSLRDITESVTWFSENPSILFVSNNPGNKGGIIAKSRGASVIQAKDTTSGIIKSLPVTVTEARLASIEISPEEFEIYLGKIQQFKATGLYTDGTKKDITESLEWQSTQPTLVSVRNTPGRKGLATSLAVGSTIIEAMDPETKVVGRTNATGREEW